VIDARWKKLGFVDPERFLTEMPKALKESGLYSLPDWKEILNRRGLRYIKEERRCAIFCYGLQAATGAKVRFANFEASDYDYVLALEHQQRKWCVPLQLKQLVSTEINSRTDLQSEIDKLRKYATSPDLVVAMHINREGTFSPADLDFSGLSIRELWFFGNRAKNNSQWRILGDVLLRNPKELLFNLPES
jgi:hypothetical protein